MNETSDIRTPLPVQCALWKADRLSQQMLYDLLEFVERLTDDDDHLRRSLMRCKECGQLYFHEFYEVADYAESNDGIYQTWIPVADAESARRLAGQPVFAILRYPSMRTNSFLGSDESTGPHWNRPRT
jgi:hypothetical protein